ncbi:MAG: O-antigen ligase family protein [Pseudomonadota bacterium]
MAEARLTFSRRRIDVITIEPDAILAFVALAGLVFVPVLKSLGALIFLAAGCALLVRRYQVQAGLCLRYWYIFALPAFCIVSVIWSAYPGATFRSGVQLAATIAIAVSIAATTSARTFSRALFVLYLIAMLASVVFGDVRNDTGAWLGIYGSKNALAGAASTFVIVSLAQVLDSETLPRLRILGLLGAMFGGLMLLMAQSISAIIVLPPAILILILLLFLYRLSPLQQVGLIVFLLIVSALMVVLALVYSDALFALLLDTTGKDATLTGRTDLWRIALALIADRPVLGMGYQAFWVKGHAAAEALWYRFGIDGRSGFNFHNTYLSNAVEIGIFGVFLQVVVLYGAAITTGIWALRTHRAEASLLFILVMMVVMVSFVEVPVFFQFSLRSVIVTCAFVYAVRGLTAARRRTITQTPVDARS